MRRSGVSIRIVPTALFLDAANKAGVPQALVSAISNPSAANLQGNLTNIGSAVAANWGGILLDTIGALAWGKIFPRTPGLRLGRFRISI